MLTVLCWDYVRYLPCGILSTQRWSVWQVMRAAHSQAAAAGSAGRGRVVLFTLANHYSYRVLHGVGAVPSARIPLRGFK